MSHSINFTKVALNAISPTENSPREVYRDTKISGLQLRVTSKGVKTFSVFKRTKNGVPERITLGRFPDMTVEQARLRAMEINAMIAKGENPGDAARDSREEPTLREAFAEYKNDYLIPHLKKTTKDMEANFNRYLSVLASKKISNIQDSDIRKLINNLGAVKGHATANRTLELIRAVINKSILWKRFKGKNPTMGIQKFKLESRDRFVQGEELPRLFKALSLFHNQMIRDFVLISLLTGARRANIMAMRWDQISFDRREWRIPETKNGSPQTVTLTVEAVQVLNSRSINGSEWVFPGDGITGHLVSPKNGWKSFLDFEEFTYLEDLVRTKIGESRVNPNESLKNKIIKLREIAISLNLDISKSRLPDLRLHDLRRTMGSWQAKTGASLVIIGKTLNHKSTMATQVYARLDSDPVRESMQNATNEMLRVSGMGIIPSATRDS